MAFIKVFVTLAVVWCAPAWGRPTEIGGAPLKQGQQYKPNVSPLERRSEFERGNENLDISRLLGPPVGFIPLYIIPRSNLKQRMRFQDKQQPLLPSMNLDNKENIDDILMGKQPEDEMNVKGMQEMRDQMPRSPEGSQLLEPPSIGLPAGHPPVSLGDVLKLEPSSTDLGSKKNIQGVDVGDKSRTHLDQKPFEFPAGQQSSDLSKLVKDVDRDEVMGQSENSGKISSPDQFQHQMGHQQMEPPRAMSRRRRDYYHQLDYSNSQSSESESDEDIIIRIDMDDPRYLY